MSPTRYGDVFTDSAPLGRKSAYRKRIRMRRKCSCPCRFQEELLALNKNRGNRETRIGNRELLGELDRDRSLRLRCCKIAPWKVFRPAVSLERRAVLAW